MRATYTLCLVAHHNLFGIYSLAPAYRFLIDMLSQLKGFASDSFIFGFFLISNSHQAWISRRIWACLGTSLSLDIRLLQSVLCDP
jgi:hypothetical protein